MIHYANSLSDVIGIYRDKISKLAEKRLAHAINETEGELTDGNWFTLTMTVDNDALKEHLLGIIDGSWSNPWLDRPVWLTLNKAGAEPVFQIRFQWCSVPELAANL